VASERDILENGVKVLGEAFITPGSSLILEGQVGAGLLHGALGLAATAFLGPIGPIARLLIAANSYSKSLPERRGILDQIGGRDQQPSGPSDTTPPKPKP
jgi:hypothetical protein